jgi:hypothetical protein
VSPKLCLTTERSTVTSLHYAFEATVAHHRSNDDLRINVDISFGCFVRKIEDVRGQLHLCGLVWSRYRVALECGTAHCNLMSIRHNRSALDRRDTIERSTSKRDKSAIHQPIFCALARTYSVSDAKTFLAVSGPSMVSPIEVSYQLHISIMGSLSWYCTQLSLL